MKRTSAVLSRLSNLTIWKMTEPEEREDQNDSTDNGSLASTSTALTALPRKHLLAKDPSDVHSLESRNMEWFAFHQVKKVKVQCRGVEFIQHINKGKKPDLRVWLVVWQFTKLHVLAISHNISWTGIQKFNMIIDTYPNISSKKLSWNIICFDIKKWIYTSCIFDLDSLKGLP